MNADTKRKLKERVIEEFKAFWVIAFYLWIFLSAFTVYRRLVIAEMGFAYLHYGWALFQALVIAKVILVGSMFGFTRRFDHRPLIVPVLYKSFLFGLLVLAFGIVERVVEALAHKEGFAGALHRLTEMGADEVAARVLILIVALIPFFAFGELGRVIGLRKLAAMFFGGPEHHETARESK
jgi:hypothetical protein